jgi:hypothetical protein
MKIYEFKIHLTIKPRRIRRLLMSVNQEILMMMVEVDGKSLDEEDFFENFSIRILLR